MLKRPEACEDTTNMHACMKARFKDINIATFSRSKIHRVLGCYVIDLLKSKKYDEDNAIKENSET